MAFAALTLLCRTARSKVARNGSGQREPKYYTHERKWWSIEETRDPTTLPLWQRDWRFGYQVLKRSMVQALRLGEKIFWDVRVLKSRRAGCDVEMLNSGLIGFCPISQEGPNRLEEGEIVKMECTACPQKRVNQEPRDSPWPKARTSRLRQLPRFSHYNYLEQQYAIEKAKELKQGELVWGTVFKIINKGIIITLPGEHEPKGLLAMIDISRKWTAHSYVHKMFPVGTRMLCYVCHADTTNGRITLSTKEFEDDDHMGWMLSFPERCFKMAEEAVGRYHEKRDAYIAMLQR